MEICEGHGALLLLLLAYAPSTKLWAKNTLRLPWSDQRPDNAVGEGTKMLKWQFQYDPQNRTRSARETRQRTTPLPRYLVLGGTRKCKCITQPDISCRFYRLHIHRIVDVFLKGISSTVIYPSACDTNPSTDIAAASRMARKSFWRQRDPTEPPRA
jgi:hypothetical protein